MVMDWYDEVWFGVPSFSVVAWKGGPAVPLLLAAAVDEPNPPNPPLVFVLVAPKPVLVLLELLPNMPPPVVLLFVLPNPPPVVLAPPPPNIEPVLVEPNPVVAAGLLAPNIPKVKLAHVL